MYSAWPPPTTMCTISNVHTCVHITHYYTSSAGTYEACQQQNCAKSQTTATLRVELKDATDTHPPQCVGERARVCIAILCQDAHGICQQADNPVDAAEAEAHAPLHSHAQCGP